VEAGRLVTVTMVRAWDPGEPAARSDRIEFAVVLDAQRHPDLQAWLDDPKPWPATRHLDGASPLHGDVAHDEDGWQLRFFVAGPDAPDVPVHRFCHLDTGFRPGEVVTLREPDGRDLAWRVVGVG
jgi:hypothetical protein